MQNGWSRRRIGFVDQDQDHLARAVMMSFILCLANDASIGAWTVEIDACGYGVKLRWLASGKR